MDGEDTGFFIMALGVLAAVLAVVTWWAFAGPATEASARPSAAVPEPAIDVAESPDDEADEADETRESADTGDRESTSTESPSADDPDPTSTPTAADPAPTTAATDDAATTPVPEDSPDTASDGPATVADVLTADPDLSAVSGLLAATNVVETLRDDGPFTVFAPSDDAIEALDDTAAAQLFGGDRAGEILRYHVVPARLSLDDLIGGTRGARQQELATAHGDPILVTLDGDQVRLNRSVGVSGDGIAAGNGVVHVIDGVLAPPEAALNLAVALEPIRFASGSSIIEPESLATLDRIVDTLATVRADVVVEGHTDDQGDPAANRALSLERARSVVNYLVANGVDETMISAEGLGADRPVADNGTDEGRALNRRIEFRLDR